MSRCGGTERMTSILANLLVNTHKVYVISLRFEGKKVAFPLDAQVTHYVLHSQKRNIFSMIRELRKFIRVQRIDCVINVDTGMGMYGILSTVGMKTRTITWEHSNFYNDWGSSKFRYLRWFAAKFSDAFVVLTEKDKENYITHIRTKTPIVVIPNPIEIHEAHYDTNSKILLSAGMLVPIKGYDTAIRTAKKVFAKSPDWKWIICGEGPERENLERLIREEELENYIILPGNVDNMDEMYQKAAMFVMTSRMEGLPMVLLEAKSWRLPIVSFDIMTGPSDIVQHGINGFLIEPDNIEKLAEAISELIESRQLRERFSQNSKIDIDKFRIETIVQKWEEVLGEH